ncbi:MAG: hypothetical protein ACM3S0_06115 [Acidobacteriota bacterium]
MEAPFRFPLKNLDDLEKLLAALDASPDLVPGSLRLTEGLDLLAEQFATEGRRKPRGGIVGLFRALWRRPLQAQRPRFLRLEAEVRQPPPRVLSLRVDVPTIDALPRWVDAEGSRDAKELARLLEIYRLLSQATRIPFISV